MTSSIRADLTHGTAYGLATSATVWIALLVPSQSSWALIAWIAIGAAVGALHTLPGRGSFIRPSYAVAFAALLFAGPLASALSAAAAALFRRLVRIGRLEGHGPQLAYAPSREVLAASAAYGAWRLTGGVSLGGEWMALFLPVVSHIAAYATTRSLVGELVRWGSHGQLRPQGAARSTALALPGFAVAAAIGGMCSSLTETQGGRSFAVAAGALLLIWSVRRLHRRRAVQCANERLAITELRLASTRALARIMEERDPATRDHARRVHRLSVGVGRSLEMRESTLETLSAAALLHDIGKLSIPESILTKPGGLTAEEMSTVRRHPVIGAEIVQALPYSESLAPMVRFHHERWDGNGYPDELRGEEIPLGARILSVVDCYDALTTERPYRQALSHREAATHLMDGSGSEFDPDVVDALLDYLEAREPGTVTEAPEKFEQSEPVVTEASECGSLALANRELEAMYDISRATDYGLRQDEFLTLAGCRLATLIPHKSLVVYRIEPGGKRLQASFAMGRAADKLRLTSVALGSRISGWAAEHRRAIIGRDHSSPIDRDGTRSDLEDWADDTEMAGLRASLASPLIAGGEVIGVIALYDTHEREFTEEEKGVLTRVAGHISQICARESDETPVARSSLTDPLSGVPNARFLLLEASHRIAQPNPNFGLIALRARNLTSFGERVGGDALDRLISQTAKRFAAGCQDGETLVRFGHDLFVVLTPRADAQSIATRADQLAAFVQQGPITIATGESHELNLNVAQVLFGEDGTTLDALLHELDRHLSANSKSRRTVIPFPTERAAQGIGR